MKVCGKCKIEKPFEDFNKHPLAKNGLNSKCKNCEREYNKQYQLNKKSKIKEYQKEYNKKYREVNKKSITEKQKEYSKKYRESNKLYFKKYHREYSYNRKKTDLLFKLKLAIRSNVCKSFKRGENKFKKIYKTETILGCTIEEFRNYIESKFVEGMTLDNYGTWHLDHIKPLALASSEEEIIKLCHYTNFQPLWAEDNLKKGAKY